MTNEGDKYELSDELPSVNRTKNLIGDIHRFSIVNEVKTNDQIKSKFIKQAQKTVNNELYSINQENTTRKQMVTYDANHEACKIYGINNHVPLWQIRLMKIGASFWFVIYFIFATLTIAPINVFFSGIKHFIKNSVIVFVFALICYLLIVALIPILIRLI